MDTYGDMVTLLLCFFVLLYSMSTIDQIKWADVVKSFNPDAILEPTQIDGTNGNMADPATQEAQEQIDAAIDKLFEEIQEYIEQQQVEDRISASKGDGYIFLSLNDAVFFDGDSYVLRGDGEVVLNQVGTMLKSARDAIDEIRILGHTAQASPTELNPPLTDRMLSSNRANVVLVYLQDMGVVDTSRMISVGYGQWRPIASNDVNTERAKNRRVEMIITGKNMENLMENSITQYYTSRQTDAPDGVIPPDQVPPPPTQTTTEGTAPSQGTAQTP